jgi:hypothetical protein
MKVAGVVVKIERTAYIAFFILGCIPVVMRAAYAALFRRSELRRRSLITIPLLGLCVAAYHALGQFVHQLGHVLAARATGYPMTGIRYEYGFAYSEYPPGEPPLPDSVHIRRSFGGVAGTTLVLTFAALLWLRRGMEATWFTRWLLAFVLLDSVLLFIGSVILSDGVLFIRDEAWKAKQPDA